MHRSVRWRAIVAISTVVACIAGVAVVAPLAAQLLRDRAERRAREPHPILVTEQEQRSLVRELLRDRRHFSVRPIDAQGRLLPEVAPGAMVLMDTSVVMCDPTSPERKPGEGDCDSRPSYYSIAASDYDEQIPRKLRVELVYANLETHPIADPQVPGVSLRARADMPRASAAFWDSFAAAFPGTVGYVEFSRAVRTADGQHALIYEQRYCHGLCFSAGTLHYFVRSAKGWRRIATAGVWIS